MTTPTEQQHTVDIEVAALRKGDRVVTVDNEIVTVESVKHLSPEFVEVTQTDGDSYEINPDCLVPKVLEPAL